MSDTDLQVLKDVANKLRIHSIKSTNAAGSGCCSCAEIMSVLFFNEMHYIPNDPRNPANDKFILSKGHCAPILYACWAEAGHIPVEKLLTLRKFDSDLEGHPTPILDFIDVATGSLGQGLAIACGMAYTAKYLEKQKAPSRIYCLMGDGECAEGSILEAMNFASFYKLDNLVAIIDANQLGQSGPTLIQIEHNVDGYAKRAEAFGFQAETINGNSVEELLRAFDNARECRDKPYLIVAKTRKGEGIDAVVGKENWHGKALGDLAPKAIEEISSRIVNKNLPIPPVKIKTPTFQLPKHDFTKIHVKLAQLPKYKMGEKVATRMAYGDALVSLADNCEYIVGLDGDVKNSTFSIKMYEKYPKRFIECYIAEQLIAGVSVGCAIRDRCMPFASTFACFWSRAFDQFRVAAISGSRIKVCGSHCGCSIGEDGPSQMGLEDIAMFRTLPKSLVIYPSDAVSTHKGLELMANYQDGVCYLRTSRPATPVIYSPEETFEIGKSKIVKQSDKDKVTIVGAGVTLFEALTAADKLSAKGINACIIDLFCVKPIDSQTILQQVRRTGGNLITVEDHYREGGIGEAISSALGMEKDIRHKSMFVTGVPRSGTPHEIMQFFGISSEDIIKEAEKLVGGAH